MRKKTIAMLLLCIPFLIGCSSGDVSSMTIKEDGTVKSYIVEEFAAAYYDLDELKQGVEADILDINEKHEAEVVKLTKFEMGDGVLKANITYQSTKAYEEFNAETLFVGTITEATKVGYDFGVLFVSDDGSGQNVKFDSIQVEDNSHVVIFTEPVNVKVDGKVLYISEGLQKGSGAKEVVITDKTKEIYYIIYE